MYAVMLFVFFFKQKTAYEMRISDWSSDVCSSDLVQVFREYLNSKIGEQSSKARQENATLFDATLFTSDITPGFVVEIEQLGPYGQGWPKPDRKSTRLNSSH